MIPMRIISLRFAAVLFALAILLGRAQGQELSASSLDGSYGFRFQGNLVLMLTLVTGEAGPPSPLFSGSGVFTADGSGHITGGSITYNYQGFYCTTSIVSSSAINPSGYSVSADGEGVLHFGLFQDQNLCTLSGMFFVTALDDVGPAGVARHVELQNFEVDGQLPFGYPTPFAIVATGEARFQQARPGVRPSPCVATDRC